VSYVLAMSCMSECSIALCILFAKCPERRAHVIDAQADAHPVIFPKSGRRRSKVGQPPRMGHATRVSDQLSAK
jgi:hypothetical protein